MRATANSAFGASHLKLLKSRLVITVIEFLIFQSNLPRNSHEFDAQF